MALKIGEINRAAAFFQFLSAGGYDLPGRVLGTIASTVEVAETSKRPGSTPGRALHISGELCIVVWPA